jgi:formate dehydrogenase iron-sulfur subunit
MTARVYVPGDSGALAVGADDVAGALAETAHRRNIALDIVRTGSRGLYWLEPMIEVATPEGRIAYGPVKPDDADGLLTAILAGGGPHPARLGPPGEIPFLRLQTRTRAIPGHSPTA